MSIDIKLEVLTKGTGDFNEDIIGYHDKYFWVIDGATPLIKENLISQQNDVVWLVKEINKEMPVALNDDLSLEKILQNVLERIQKTALTINPDVEHIEKSKMPTFAIAMVRITDQELEYYVLGDCGVIVQDKSNQRYFTDERIKKFSLKNKRAFETNKKEGKKSLLEVRNKLNTDDGYWIGSLDSKGIAKGLTGKITVMDTFLFMMFSDGFSRSFELYNITEWHNLKLDKDEILNEVLQIRNIEEDDAVCEKYPRAKKSDDLSVILCERRA